MKLKNTLLHCIEEKVPIIEIEPIWFASYTHGVHGEIRTLDLFLRRETLYPAELREHETII